jgi:nucleoside-diphosphate-sugar epimerase
MARVLVTGATGAIGPAVVRAFADARDAVTVIARGTLPNALSDVVSSVHRGDITDPALVARAMRDTDIVVHLAALLHMMPGSGVTPEEYARVNVDGTRVVMGAARAAGVSRVVLASTIAVYGESPSSVVNEASPPAPATPYARTKLQAEHLALAASAEGPPVVVLRFAAVYGARMKGNYRQLADAIARGRFIAPGPGRNRRSLIHDSDAAAAVLLAAAHPAAPGRIFNVADATPYTMRQVIAAIAPATGRAASKVYIPKPLALAAASAITLAARTAGRRSPITREMVIKYNEDLAVDATAIGRDLGFRSEVSLEEGWRRTLRGQEPI